MEIRKLVGRNVRRLREAQSLTQEELAFSAELDRSYVNGIERGIRNPTVTVIARIAEALGVRPDELLLGVGATSRPPSPKSEKPNPR